MKAAVITQFGGPEGLQIRDLPTPTPRERDVLVRVHASALNRADVLQRLGRYPAPNDAPSDVPGLELAGTVEIAGSAPSRWRRGDRVFGIIGGGAHAEFAVVHEEALAAVPALLDWPQAAAVPEAFITAHDALITQAALRRGESVLILAVGSGVGLAATQIVRAWGGVPFGASRTAEKIERAREFGLENGVALEHGPEGLAAAVARWTRQRGVDVVLDLVGGPYVSACLDSLAPKGRMMLVGAVAGSQATIDIRRILGKRLILRGTVLRARSLEEKIEVTRAFAREVTPRVASGELRPVIDSVFPLERIAEAHRRMESNETFGKIVITM
jgi:putative PIG3 family NAD(P)H quinone oxidoreductase